MTFISTELVHSFVKCPNESTFLNWVRDCEGIFWKENNYSKNEQKNKVSQRQDKYVQHNVVFFFL